MTDQSKGESPAPMENGQPKKEGYPGGAREALRELLSEAHALDLIRYPAVASERIKRARATLAELDKLAEPPGFAAGIEAAAKWHEDQAAATHYNPVKRFHLDHAAAIRQLSPPVPEAGERKCLGCGEYGQFGQHERGCAPVPEAPHEIVGVLERILDEIQEWALSGPDPEAEQKLIDAMLEARSTLTKADTKPSGEGE